MAIMFVAFMIVVVRRLGWFRLWVAFDNVGRTHCFFAFHALCAPKTTARMGIGERLLLSWYEGLLEESNRQGRIPCKRGPDKALLDDYLWMREPL
jgi:hypothetical protein